MIEYIINNVKGCLIYQSESIKQSNKTNISIIKELCMEAFFSYEGYLKAVQKKYGKSYLIPLYVNEQEIFIPIKRTRDYDNIWFNYAALTEVNIFDNEIELVFQSKRKLKVNISLNSLKRQIKYLEAIRNAKVKHFHF